MPAFGSVSRSHLAELRPELQLLMNEVIRHVDCTIIDGARTIEEQRKNVAKGVSKTMASKHLPDVTGKSRAVDVMPYPFNWGTIQKGLDAVKRAEPTMQVCRCYWFAGFVAGIAAARGIQIRQGVDWDGDREVGDHEFIDLPHTELAP
jgi:peptidoglycan L-alanyl-D-glutamate endopeptidase CwlK